MTAARSAGSAVPPSWVRRLPTYAGAAAMVLAALMLLGWARQFSVLADTMPALPTMKANSAVAVVLGGASLVSRRRWARWLALVPLLIGVATTFEWITGQGLGIDQLLIRDTFTAHQPGRTSPQGAIALVAFAAARIASGSPRTRVAEVGGMLTAVFACVALVLELGWIFQAPELTSANGGAGISAPSAVCVGLLVLGLAGMHAQRRPLVYLWDTGLTGTVVRRMLPTVVIAPPALGLLRLLGQDLGWYGLNLGVALLVGSMMLLSAVVVTVTAQSIHRLEGERARISRELEAIFDSVPAALTMRDAEGRLLRFNRPTTADAGADGAYTPLLDNLDELATHESDVLSSGRPITRSYGPTSDGREYEITKFPVYDADGSVLGIGGFGLDVTARSRAVRALQDAEQRARQLAERDPLTGIWNRRWFEAELGAVLGHRPTEGRSGALLVVDVDHFKQVNDTAGHHTGDQLLVAVANALVTTVGDRGSVSRVGGDEFAVILPWADRAMIDRTADRIVRNVRSAAHDLGQTTSTVTASVGIAVFADLSTTDHVERTVLVRADEALYAAKRDGRGRFLCYDPALMRSA